MPPERPRRLSPRHGGPLAGLPVPRMPLLGRQDDVAQVSRLLRASHSTLGC
jgi:hypothetical protein